MRSLGQVVDVKRVSDRLMTIKLVIGGFTLHVCSVYTPQVVLEEEVKTRFCEALDEVVRSVPSSKKIVIAGEFNGHIGVFLGGYDDSSGDGLDYQEEQDEKGRGGAASCITESAREVLGISRGQVGRHKGDWWWNKEVKKKVESKKGVYVKLIESKDAEEKRLNRKVYKVARKESKLAVMAAKTASFESLCFKFEDVIEAIRKMQRGRATRPDEISMEF
ncbi:uncharacterized protein LOC107876401 [Capsicum annuum]|uniref:uncharacterized protein LOC107876401 n=1 Tax=Capsicum annuum TaxID=4072 RepID=UPI001FB18A37|nr:uncharacterized protein LOC107876401 [Capsicum annuum]